MPCINFRPVSRIQALVLLQVSGCSRYWTGQKIINSKSRIPMRDSIVRLRHEQRSHRRLQIQDQKQPFSWDIKSQIDLLIFTTFKAVHICVWFKNCFWVGRAHFWPVTQPADLAISQPLDFKCAIADSIILKTYTPITPMSQQNINPQPLGW